MSSPPPILMFQLNNYSVCTNTYLLIRRLKRCQLNQLVLAVSKYICKYIRLRSQQSYKFVLLKRFNGLFKANCSICTSGNTKMDCEWVKTLPVLFFNTTLFSQFYTPTWMTVLSIWNLPCPLWSKSGDVYTNMVTDNFFFLFQEQRHKSLSYIMM